MANFSGLGQFAEGVAGGISKGLSSYAGLAVKGKELGMEREKMDIAKTQAEAEAQKQQNAEADRKAKMALDMFEKGWKIYDKLDSTKKVEFATQQAKTTSEPGDAAMWQIMASGDQRKIDLTKSIIDSMGDAMKITDPQLRANTLRLYSNAFTSEFGTDHPMAIQYMKGNAGSAYIGFQKANQFLLEKLASGDKIDTPEEIKMMQDRDMYGEIVVKSQDKDLLDLYQKDMDATNAIIKEQSKAKKSDKNIERTIDLGDKQRIIYADGTQEDIKKGVSPNTQVRINVGDQKSDARFSMGLRKEFNAIGPVKDYRDINTKYTIMQEAFKESKTTKQFVAVDQALITLYNKMTDPQSVVRESEYVRTPEDMAIKDRAEAAIIRLQKGGRLESDSRQAIMTMATKFKEAYERKYNEIANEYRGYANSAGISPDDVVKPIKEEKQQMRDIARAVDYLKSSKDRNDAKARMKSLMQKGWDEDELRNIEKQAGY